MVAVVPVEDGQVARSAAPHQAVRESGAAVVIGGAVAAVARQPHFRLAQQLQQAGGRGLWRGAAGPAAGASRAALTSSGSRSSPSESALAKKLLPENTDSLRSVGCPLASSGGGEMVTVICTVSGGLPLPAATAGPPAASVSHGERARCSWALLSGWVQIDARVCATPSSQSAEWGSKVACGKLGAPTRRSGGETFRDPGALLPSSRP